MTSTATEHATPPKDADHQPQSGASNRPGDAPGHMNLGEMTPNTYVEGTYAIVNPQVGTTRGGKPFLKCLLRDATGESAARMWSFEEASLESISATGFVQIRGNSQLYNGQVQLVIEQIRSVEVGASELTRLLPSTSKDIDEMFAALRTKMTSLEHPAMLALADAYLDDEDLMAKFKTAPAAMNLHHAWIGGLLEHTLQLLDLADTMLPLYPKLNRDVVLMGLFLHDMGKTSELVWDRGFDYTADGNLIGHIVRGAIWLQFKAAVAAKQSGHRLPSEALRVLQHIIISHHGRPEYGAAKIPATPEAIFISQLDDLDAKTTMALGAARPDTASADFLGDFTDRMWALDTRLYRPDPLADDQTSANQG